MYMWAPQLQVTPLNLSKAPAAKIERLSPNLPLGNSSPPMQALDYRVQPRYNSYENCGVPDISNGQQLSLSAPPLALLPPLALSRTQLQEIYDRDQDLLSKDPEYQLFEQNFLSAIKKENGGNLLVNNPRMRRSVLTTETMTDEAYRQQREKNNAAAKRSRDRRKLREHQLAVQVSYLKSKITEMENILQTPVCSRCEKLL